MVNSATCCWCFRAQHVFRTALRSSVIRLRVIRRRSLQTQTVTQQPGGGSSSTKPATDESLPRSVSSTGVVPADTAATAAPAIKVPPAVPPRSATTSLSGAKNKFTQISSTRLIGKLINIELTKGEWRLQHLRDLFLSHKHRRTRYAVIRLFLCSRKICIKSRKMISWSVPLS